MQNKDQAISLPLKSLLFAIGGLVIFISGVASLYFGISDGSLIFILPLLASPFVSVIGITYGIKAINNNIDPKTLAIAGVISGSLSLFIITAVTAIALMWISGLADIY